MAIDRVGGLPTPQTPDSPGARRVPTEPLPRPANDARVLLTSEERAYFAELEQLGRLTYGPRAGASPTVAAPLGQRVDVRA